MPLLNHTLECDHVRSPFSADKQSHVINIRDICCQSQPPRFSLNSQSTSLHCSRTCHEIPGIVRLHNGSQRLVLISRMDTRICVFISGWLVSYVPCDWSHSCEIFHAMLKINIIACILYVLFCCLHCLVCLFREFMLSLHRKAKRKSATFWSLHSCLWGTLCDVLWGRIFKVVEPLDRVMARGQGLHNFRCYLHVASLNFYHIASYVLQVFAFEGQVIMFTLNVLLTCILYCGTRPGCD